MDVLHLDTNRANWDERAPAHAASPEYAVESFLADPAFLSDVVRFDRPRLDDLTGLRAVHLQCHIGTDTISLARLGADVTGLDFSPVALDLARALAVRTGATTRFVEAELHSAVEVLGSQQFDLVYTGVGALCWLPEVGPWARIVAALLRPGGRLSIREIHPMLYALDEKRVDGLLVGHPYFEHAAPFVEDDDGTYVEAAATFTHTVSYSWNHGLGEVVSALLDAGLELTGLDEHDSVPFNALPGQMTCDDGEWRLTDHPERLAASYTIRARRR